jgi:predicted DNA-binding antitoxin AbrB/MazE fold protein
MEPKTMTLIVEAPYQNGVLKPAHPLPLQENESVRVTVHSRGSLAEQTAGMMDWKGDAETLERLLAENEEDA